MATYEYWMRCAEKYREQGRHYLVEFCEKTANDVKRNAELVELKEQGSRGGDADA